MRAILTRLLTTRLSVLAVAAALSAGAGRAQAETIEDMVRRMSQERDIPHAETHMVMMRDGVKLATDVTLPGGKTEKAWPVVLLRTPYNRKGKMGELMSTLLPPAGFVAVTQDIRGRFGSEGEDFPVHGGCAWGKIQDGYDTIAWIAEQPWCNGDVGMLGPSAMGATQNLTIPTQPPALKMCMVIVAWADIYKHAAYWGGVPRRALPEGWIASNDFDERNLDLFWSHPSYDAFWASWDTTALAHKVNIPVLYFGGWYDHFCQGTIDSFEATQRRGMPEARKGCRLIMGPWMHTGIPKGLDYPDNANPRYEIWGMRWLMRHLKDTEIVRSEKQAAVNYYVMGASGEPDAPGHAWRTAETWPMPSTMQRYYLRKGGLLTTEKPTETKAVSTYRYDPRDPAPSIGGGVLSKTVGIQDQRPVEARADVIVFSTPPLAEPVEATGRIKVRLWASSSAKDTDYTAKLTDVYPDGRSLLVLDGIVRARYHASLSEPELVPPGEIREVEIDLWSTSLIFNKGHRIRVAISSSNAPRFRPNPNTGDPVEDPDRAVVATNTIYYDAAHPSHLILPKPKE